MPINPIIAKNLRRDKTLVPISIRIFDTVRDDLKEVAALLGYAGYQALARHYIGQGLRRDLEKIQEGKLDRMAASLRSHGVQEDVVQAVINELVHI